MDLPGDRHLAFDLLETDLEDPASIAALVARHGIAPARRLFGFAEPARGEHRSRMLLGGSFTLVVANSRPTWHVDPTAATVEPVLRGLALVAALFPGALDLRATDVERAALFEALPGLAIPDRAMELALVYWEEIEWLAARALGIGRPLPDDPHTSLRLDAQAGRDGIERLARAKSLVERALLPVEDADELLARAEVGLDALNVGVADEIDEILAEDARLRLLRISDPEMVPSDGPPPLPDAPDLYTEVLVERGVVPVTLPQTVEGLVAVDFVETLRLGRQTGLCANCLRPFLLESQQASLVRRGQPVYHPGCFRERRKRYMRDYRAGRVGARASEAPRSITGANSAASASGRARGASSSTLDPRESNSPGGPEGRPGLSTPR